MKSSRNDLPLDFNGVSVTMNVQGKRFATGVSDAGGSVPRFGSVRFKSSGEFTLPAEITRSGD